MCSSWTRSCAEWLRSQGFLKPERLTLLPNSCQSWFRQIEDLSGLQVLRRFEAEMQQNRLASESALQGDPQADAHALWC